MSDPDASVQSRPYQETSRDKIFGEWDGGKDSTLLVLPTGTGKTVVAGMVHRRALDAHHRRGLFIAHREELINQAADKIGRFGLSTAIEMGPHKARDNEGLLGRADVTIATVQTLQGRRLESWNPRSFGVITIDEAHHARASTYRNVLDWFEGYWLLGITATPDRGDRKNLGAVFESLAFEYPLRAAIREGYLVPLVTARLQTEVDLKSIRTTGGDYNQADLEEAIGPFIEPLARAMAAEIGTRPTVVFTPDVGSAELMADALRKLGVAAEAVSGRMPRDERRACLERLSEGVFQVVVCCDLLTEGWDEPQIACVVVCRPTKKRNRYAQMIGRGTRPHQDSGKVDCLIVDFAWQTTAGHELCTPVDLFDGSNIPDAAVEEAKAIQERGEEADPDKALELAEERLRDRERREQAEALLRERERLKIKLTGRTTPYKKTVYDPVGVGHLIGVPFKQGWDYSDMNPATTKQLDLLVKLGVSQPAGMSKQGASRLIDAIFKRREAGLGTVKQVATLQSLGVDLEEARAMGFAEASETIGRLINRSRSVG